MDISIIIPAFNGGESICRLTGKIRETLSDKYSYEIILVFDKGAISTWQIITELKKENPDSIRIFSLYRNYGQHRAIMFGISKAEGDYIVTMDEDLQHNPSDIIYLIEEQKTADYDLVYGKFTNLKHSGFRKLVSVFLRKILKQFLPALYPDYSPYRFMKREVALQISVMTPIYIFIDDCLSRTTQKISFVNITHFRRPAGKSSYNLSKLLKHTIYILFAFSKSILWLRISSLIILSIAALLYIESLYFSKYNLIPSALNSISAWLPATGILLLIISISGTIINRKNKAYNLRPVRLADEDTI